MEVGRPSYKSEKWLKQFGWEEGKGLGRNEDGMRDFIHVSKKTDSLGVGASRIGNQDRQGFSWWDNLYNKAAASISVDPGAVEGKQTTKAPNKPKMTSSGAPTFVKAQDEYGTVEKNSCEDKESEQPKQKTYLSGAFVSGGSFVLGKKESDHSSDTSTNDNDQPEKSYASGLNENDVFAACGGRILSQWKYPAQGRQKRLAEHERQWQENRDKQQKEKADTENAWEEQKRKGKKKKSKREKKQEEDVTLGKKKRKAEKKQKEEKDSKKRNKKGSAQ